MPYCAYCHDALVSVDGTLCDKCARDGQEPRDAVVSPESPIYGEKFSSSVPNTATNKFSAWWHFAPLFILSVVTCGLAAYLHPHNDINEMSLFAASAITLPVFIMMSLSVIAVNSFKK